MARRKLEVNEQRLSDAIVEAEGKQEFATLNDLWNVAADIYNGNTPEGEDKVTSSVVMLRVKEFGISTKTKPGKRGRGAMSEEQKAAMQAGRGVRVSRRTKIKKNPHYQESVAAIREQAENNGDNQRLEKVLDRFEKGSVKAALRLFCFNCVGSMSDIKTCGTKTCPFWIHRPLQHEWQKNGTSPTAALVTDNDEDEFNEDDEEIEDEE